MKELNLKYEYATMRDVCLKGNAINTGRPHIIYY